MYTAVRQSFRAKANILESDQAGLLRKGLKVIFVGLLIAYLSDFAFRFSDL